MRQLFIILFTTTLLFGWGKTGHRIIGKIAEENLSYRAKKNITKILGHTDLARVGNWADEIKADSTWDHTHNWHYCTIKPGHKYEGPEDGGYAVEKLEEFIKQLKGGQLSKEEELNTLRFLIHIVGDLHQPLHVGNGTDRGGNDVKVTWFHKKTNLHRVWDSQMIEHMDYSYTEYAQQIQLGLNKQDKAKLLDKDVRHFIYGSQAIHKNVYDIGDGNLSWKYVYKNRKLMEDRLLKGGYHLAAILNDIYG